MMDSQESYRIHQHAADSHFEVFSRVEASFDKAWVEGIGTDLCRILEEIEKLGVEISFKKGQHVLCGTLKQVQSVEDLVCRRAARVEGQHYSSSNLRESGRPFDSLPAQYHSNFLEYRPEHEYSFDNKSQRYDTGLSRVHAPHASDERGGTWNKPTELASHPGMQLSNVGADYGGVWKEPIKVEHCGNVPSDYTEKITGSVEERNVYKLNCDTQQREVASDGGEKKLWAEDDNEEMQLKHADEKKSAGKEDKGIRAVDEGTFQELMVDKDIWEYIEVKMSQQWMAIQEFGAKIAKIVEGSGMFRLHITPMSSEDDSDAVGLVYDSLAGLYNEVQGSIIMEVLHLTPTPSNVPINTMVLQFINSQFPVVHVKSCAKLDHYYFIGPIHEVYQAFKMFPIALRIAMENEILQITQLREKIEELQREASRALAADGIWPSSSARQAGVGSDMGITAAAAYVPNQDHYEGMAVGNFDPSTWKRHGGDLYSEDPYDMNEYESERSQRCGNRESDWSYWSYPSNIGNTRAGAAGDFKHRADPRHSYTGSREEFHMEKRPIGIRNNDLVSDVNYENQEFHLKNADYESDSDVRKLDESTHRGGIRMKADSVNATGRDTSSERYKRIDQECERDDRVRDISSLSKLEIAQANDELNASESVSRENGRGEMKQFCESDSHSDKITEKRDVDLSDTKDDEQVKQLCESDSHSDKVTEKRDVDLSDTKDDEQTSRCKSFEVPSDPSKIEPSKFVERVNSLD